MSNFIEVPTHMQPVSTCLTDVKYNTATSTLEATFPSGSRYEYADVTTTEYLRIVAADSVGKAFNKEFKGKHPKYRKIA